MFLKDLMNGEYDSRSDGSCAVVDMSIPSANWKSQLSTLRIVVSVPCGVGVQFGIASEVGGFARGVCWSGWQSVLCDGRDSGCLCLIVRVGFGWYAAGSDVVAVSHRAGVLSTQSSVLRIRYVI